MYFLDLIFDYIYIWDFTFGFIFWRSKLIKKACSLNTVILFF